MMKQFFFTASALLLASVTNAQTVFTAGKTTITKEEFLRAFGKNNTSNDRSEKAFRDYLELYTRFKLKVQAAYDAKLDTLSTQKAELENFRNQVAESYLNDENSTQELLEEAFVRSQTDIRISHIYIAAGNETDSTTARKKAEEAYEKLMAGADFGAVAEAYSGDTEAKANKGDLGFITVFSLPYTLESLAYNTPLGKVSKPYRSKIGYHIFKRTEERPAAGKMKAAQILLAFPPDADAAQKQQLKKLADSLHKALKSGASFEKLAATYSNDNTSYQNGGALTEFGVGVYSADFEKAAYALKNDGDLTEPLATAFGYHIIKRLGRAAINADRSNAEAMQSLKQRVQADNRMLVARQAMIKKIITTIGYKKGVYAQNNLLVYADSAINNKKLPQLTAFNNKTILFSFPKQKVTALDFSNYLKAISGSEELMQGKKILQLLDQYVGTVAVEYYKNNMEQYNPAFTYQVNEFKEGNLLFEIMQRQVWDKAPADSNGLEKYYNENKSKYWWEPSADVILFTCADTAVAAKTREAFLKNKNAWKTFGENPDGTVQADSSRYELEQLPINDKNLLKAGYLSQPVKSSSDNITTFLYIVRTYTEKMPRKYEDAKGFVINDYQQFLEEKWVQQLKTKYSVKVNDAVLQSLWK
jgi:peptidyl-prolyl cis-trans isomerase SurA